MKSHSTNSAQTENPKKPWVFIIGGTGEQRPPELQIVEQELGKLNQELKKLQEEFSKFADNSPANDEYDDSMLFAAPKKTSPQENGRTFHEINDDIEKCKNEILKKQTDRENILRRLSGSYNAYLPQDNMLEHVHIVSGVRSIDVNKSAQDQFESGNILEGLSELEFKKVTAKDTYDHLTATSEGKRIKECMNALKEAEKNGELPDTIVLNGHSRGASACIELARAIYLKYGDKIKIVMNINDPVPGPFRHAKSKMVIPPNVESLVITYAGNEKSKIFKPQDLREIIYDSTKTTVTAISLPATHNTAEANQLRSINQALCSSLTGTQNNDKPEIQLPSSGVNNPITSGSRKRGRFVVASNGNLEKTSALQAFHDKLRNKTGTPLSVPKFSTADANKIPDSRKARKQELNRIIKDETTAKKYSKKFNQFVKGKKKIKEMPELKVLINRFTTWNEDDRGPGIFTNIKNENFKGNIETLHKGNNTIVKITDPVTSQSVILQVSSKTTDTDNIKALKSLENTSYLTKIYHSQSQGNTTVSIIEYCPQKLSNQARDIANKQPSDKLTPIQKKREADNLRDEKIMAVQTVATKIADILNDLTKNQIIWKDLKPDNLLIRQDGSLAISDLKAFFPLNSNQSKNIDAFTSKNLLPNNMKSSNEIDPFPYPTDKTPQEVWNKIYNHQVANILYQHITGKLVVNDITDKNKNESKQLGFVSAFTFEHPFFKTDEGKKIGLIIHGLANNVVSYSDAAELLTHIKNNDNYNYNQKFQQMTKLAELAKTPLPTAEATTNTKKRRAGKSTPKKPTTDQKSKDSVITPTVPIKVEQSQPPVQPQVQVQIQSQVQAQPQQPHVGHNNHIVVTDRVHGFLDSVTNLITKCEKLMTSTELTSEQNDNIKVKYGRLNLIKSKLNNEMEAKQKDGNYRDKIHEISTRYHVELSIIDHDLKIMSEKANSKQALQKKENAPQLDASLETHKPG